MAAIKINLLFAVAGLKKKQANIFLPELLLMIFQ